MVQIEVNVDSFAYHGPAPREGADRPLLFATRGQLIDLDEAEADRARGALVGQVYADPLGGAGSVRRLEPTVIEPGAKDAGADSVAEWNDKRARLRDELAKLEANAPLVATAPAPALEPPTLSPSLTGLRNVAPMVAADADAEASAEAKGARKASR